MNIRDKQSYHHGNLREQLMITAIEHLATQGTEGLSLRAIARELGVSQTAPYRHFRDKNALLAALSTDGFQTLTNAMRAATEEHRSDAARALQLCGVAYIQFARAHPQQYKLMFGQRVLDASLYPELQTVAEESFQVLKSIIGDGIEQGIFKPQPEELVANTAWALVHGLATLIMDRLEGAMPESVIQQQIKLATTALIEKI